MVQLGSGSLRDVQDFMLTRYACYLIAQIRPEELPPAEDIKKLERRVASEEKKIEKTSSKLPKKK